MRNKDKIIAFFLALALLSPVLAAAQTDETNQTRPQRDTREQTRRDQVARHKRLAQTQYNRTKNAIDRLSSMVDKIESYMAKLRERGVTISSVEASVDAAKALRAEIETMLEDLKARHESIDPEGTEPKRRVQAFMTSMKAIKKKLIELHRSLKSIVKELRNLEKSDRASSTPTTNSEADNASGE